VAKCDVHAGTAPFAVPVFFPRQLHFNTSYFADLSSREENQANVDKQHGAAGAENGEGKCAPLSTKTGYIGRIPSTPDDK
jgi:hypothetical protein